MCISIYPRAYELKNYSFRARLRLKLHIIGRPFGLLGDFVIEASGAVIVLRCDPTNDRPAAVFAFSGHRVDKGFGSA